MDGDDHFSKHEKEVAKQGDRIYYSLVQKDLELAILFLNQSDANLMKLLEHDTIQKTFSEIFPEILADIEGISHRVGEAIQLISDHKNELPLDI